jgi:adenylylsulfate kinase-like enzyme
VKRIRVDHLSDATDAVAALIVEQGARLVRIDGHSAAGKSSLAKQLARVLSGIHVETDAYLIAGGSLQQEQLTDNMALYLTSGLYVILEGIRLEERFPSVGLPAFCIVVTPDFKSTEDATRSASTAAMLGVDKYLEQYRPIDHASVEVIVTVPDGHAEQLAAIDELNHPDRNG